VYVGLVDGIRREWIEVRSAVRFLKRDEVRHECDIARTVPANERVHVGIVDRRVGRDEWRLAVTGRTCAAGPKACGPGGQGEPERGECSAQALLPGGAHGSSLDGAVLAWIRPCRIGGWVAVRFHSLTHPRCRLLRIRPR